MRSLGSWLAWALTTVAASACGDASTIPGTPDGTLDASRLSPDAGGAAVAGSFSLLTYNVAGLPELLSGSQPATNTPLISPRLNAFDVVLVQEDFSYHAQLAASATHPHQSTPSTPVSIALGVALGDGLNVFSRIPFAEYTRIEWSACNGYVSDGTDCLAPKGFAVGTFELAPGCVVDVYDLHADAGRSSKDYEARERQIAQLVAFIGDRGADRAIIVAGDTNMEESDEPVLQQLLAGAGLSDACRELGCSEPTRIDRILFRSSSTLTLTPMNWRVDSAFVDANGAPLSDHDPVAVELHWAAP